MELYQELLAHILSKQEIQVTFSNFTIDANELVEQTCYKLLRRIRDIVRDDSLSDPECFAQIEAIVSEFEALGCGCGTRHDFG